MERFASPTQIAVAIATANIISQMASNNPFEVDDSPEGVNIDAELMSVLEVVSIVSSFFIERDFVCCDVTCIGVATAGCRALAHWSGQQVFGLKEIKALHRDPVKDLMPAGRVANRTPSIDTLIACRGLSPWRTCARSAQDQPGDDRKADRHDNSKRPIGDHDSSPFQGPI
jgi:hypothetical protein